LGGGYFRFTFKAITNLNLFMKKTLSMVGILCLLVNLACFAQTNSPNWKVDIENKASWMKILPTGVVLVATNTNLICVNPETRATQWELKDIGQVSEETFLEVNGTPFASFDASGGLKSMKTQTYIINYATGKVIYSTKEQNVSIQEKTPLLDIGALLLELKQEKSFFLALVDIQTGTERWRMPLTNRKSGIGLGALKQSINSSLDAQPVADLDNNILFPDDKVLSRLDGATGKVLWSVANEKSVGRLNLSEDGKAVYVGAGRKIVALSVDAGKEMWKEPVKISGEFQMFVDDADNQMFVVTDWELNKVDKVTGQPVWKKPFAFSRAFASFKRVNGNVLIFGTDEKSSSFSYIGKDGQSIWKRSYETSVPVVSFDVLPKGILFASAEEANIIDLSTGDDSIWKKRIKLKGSPVTYIDQNIGLIYAEKRLYAVDMNTLQYKLVNEEIKFEGKDEDAQQIELVPNGYLLSSQQNMVVVSPDGKIVYAKYFKPVSFGGTAGKILGTVGKIYATTQTLEMEQTAPNTYTIKRSQTGDDIVGGINDVIANRKKSFSSQTSSYIMTYIEEGGNKSAGMVKVDKNTGEIQSKIVLKTQDPIYAVDAPTGQLFVITNGVAKGAELASFGL
jgi:hypothetical protein